MSAPDKLPPLDRWKGGLISRMNRAELEREFIVLATAERDRTQPYHGAGLQPITGPANQAPPLDPHTARVLREFREVISQIESGELALRRFSDELIDTGALQRNVSIAATFIPPKAKT